MNNNVEYEQLGQSKNNFYRDQYRRMMKFLIMLVFICGGFLVALLFLMVTTPTAKYYASTTTGSVVPIQSLSSPVVTMPFIEKWAGIVVRSTYTLDFLKYHQQLDKAKTYFTQEGWSKFQIAMKNSGYLQSVIENKLDISTVINGPVIVSDRYIDHGHYTWLVQVPLLALYTSASEHQKKQFYVTLTIKRVPELLVSRGIAVTDFVSHGQLS